MRGIYAIAHPEATHHVEGVVGGWHDSQLTPAGRRAAARIARALRAVIPDGAEVELITSDLQRARQTADEVAEVFGAKPVLDRRLREKSYGEAEGRPREWLDRRFVPRLRPGIGWDTTRACGVPRPEGSVRGACTRPWTRPCGAHVSTRSS
ncbi:histidine phosphatase family protein [Streptomyces sp. FXJ1.4098]|nr:histidine phosphatase family protein [Streptomyces sp. FXJ1.4098]